MRVTLQVQNLPEKKVKHNHRINYLLIPVLKEPPKPTIFFPKNITVFHDLGPGFIVTKIAYINFYYENSASKNKNTAEIAYIFLRISGDRCPHDEVSSKKRLRYAITR